MQNNNKEKLKATAKHTHKPAYTADAQRKSIIFVAIVLRSAVNMEADIFQKIFSL